MSELSRKRQRASSEPSRLYARRREAMIKAAAQVFRDKGLADASLDEISALIGVERASLYYYVGSKDQLFRAVILESTEAVVARSIAIIRGPGTCRTRLTEVITHIVNSFSDHYPSMHIFVREDMRRMKNRDDPQSRAEHERLAELADRYMEALEDLIRQGIDAHEFRAIGDPRVAALVVQGALNWMHRWYDPTTTDGTAELVSAFVTILLDGMATPAALIGHPGVGGLLGPALLPSGDR